MNIFEKKNLFKLIYNFHRWDSIQCEFKSVFIQFLTKILFLCKVCIQILKNYKFFCPQYDYVQFSKKLLQCYSNCNHP